MCKRFNSRSSDVQSGFFNKKYPQFGKDIIKNQMSFYQTRCRPYYYTNIETYYARDKVVRTKLVP